MEEMLVESKKKIPAKRVNVVSLKVVKESSVLYETRNITNPYDASVSYTHLKKGRISLNI